MKYEPNQALHSAYCKFCTCSAESCYRAGAEWARLLNSRVSATTTTSHLGEAFSGAQSYSIQLFLGLPAPNPQRLGFTTPSAVRIANLATATVAESSSIEY